MANARRVVNHDAGAALIRIGLNALALRSHGSGVQTYISELLRALPNAWSSADFVAAVTRHDVALVPSGVSPAPVSFPFDHGATRKLVSAFRPFSDVDVVHGLDTDTSLRRGGAKVVTVHDLALFDAPWAFGRGARFAKRRLVAAAISGSDAIISVSAFTADRVAHHFGRDSIVIHEAAASAFTVPTEAAVAALRHRYSLPETFVLYVGNLEPRKDVPTLAAAAAQAGLPLVITGGAMQTVTLPGRVQSIGYVPQSELPALYRAATVVGYVARYEGFGLPPVEAMASGACVMATRVGALPDIAGGSIEFVPAQSVDAQTAMLQALVNDADRRKEMCARSVEAAAKLSWATTAAQTVDVYRSLL